MRFTVELEADNRRSSHYQDGETLEGIALQAIRGWRYDAHMVSPKQGKAGTDLYGEYRAFDFQAGRRWATVKIRIERPEQALLIANNPQQRSQ